MINKQLRLMLLACTGISLGACGDDSSGPSLDCIGGSPISVGSTVSGTLQEGDELDVDGGFLDRYALAVTRSTTIQIDMRSNTVDSFLWLLTEDYDEITNDDDGGGNLDAHIVRNLGRGCYLVEATTFPGETGGYTLTVQRD